MSVSPIIKFLNDYLIKNNVQSLTAVEANAILAKAGFLKDSKDRPGKPLREILRKGMIPHAYQTGGKGSNWIIPRLKSSVEPTAKVVSAHTPKNANASAVNKSVIHDASTATESARLQYKPNSIKCLLIAEAPPNALDRFFYYRDVPTHDHLFLGVIGALYPDLKEQYLSSGRSSLVKEKILRTFQADGFYLIDLSEVPLSKGPLSTKTLEALLPRVKTHLGSETKVIIIKSNVYELCYARLHSAYGDNIVNSKVPFPSTGHQKKFYEAFTRALTLAGLRPL